MEGGYYVALWVGSSRKPVEAPDDILLVSQGADPNDAGCLLREQRVWVT